MAWHYFGGSKPKKSTKELYKEMKKLEKQEKEAQERALIQQRIADIKREQRQEIYRKSLVGRINTSASRIGSGIYRGATSPKAKKAYKKLSKTKITW